MALGSTSWFTLRPAGDNCNCLMKEHIRHWAAGSVIVRWILPLTTKFLLWLINMVHRLKYILHEKNTLLTFCKGKHLPQTKRAVASFTVIQEFCPPRAAQKIRKPCGIIIWNVWKPVPKAIDLADYNLDPGLMAANRATRALFVNRHTIPFIVI